jgi:hypothetical protein
MAGAIPTNSARTQSESVASLAVASDGGRDGFRRPGHRQAAVLFSAIVHRRRPRDRACCPAGSEEPYLKCGGLHPTPANISTLAADRRNGRLQLKSASSPFPSVHRADLEGPQGVDLTRSPNGRRVTAIDLREAAGWCRRKAAIGGWSIEMWVGIAARCRRVFQLTRVSFLGRPHSGRKRRPQSELGDEAPGQIAHGSLIDWLSLKAQSLASLANGGLGTVS